jgi:uncharacterized delta-60 repeat protein
MWAAVALLAGSGAASGTEPLWTAVYDGPGGADDFSTEIAVDAAGNVIVGGTSRTRDAGFDLVTEKLDPAGRRLWAARYDGKGSSPENRDDRLAGIAVDSVGNVHVTGTSESPAGTDYITVKYDTEGHELWASRFDGPVSGDDRAVAIALDPSGNVIVTGASDGSPLNVNREDYATVKYDPDGKLLWVARHDGPARLDDSPAAVKVDREGNIFVTGTSFAGSADFLTVKYDPDGRQLWTARFDGPEHASDRPVAMDVDAAGSAYVAGPSLGEAGRRERSRWETVKYGADGTQLWSAEFDIPETVIDEPTALAADAKGGVFVAGVSGFKGEIDRLSWVTVRYDSSGDLVWAEQIQGRFGGADRPNAMALDGEGDVHVTGTLDLDFLTVKYSPAGDPLWSAAYDGPGPDGSFEEAFAVAVDARGSTYVTGPAFGPAFFNGEGHKDYATVKYDRNGAQVWASRYDGEGNAADFPEAIVADPSGDIYVAGGSTGSGTGSDLAIVKYSPGGEEVWSRRLDGPDPDLVFSLALDGAGDIYAAGFHQTPSELRVSILKHDPAGVLLWTAEPDLHLKTTPPAPVMAVEHDGSLLLAASIRDTDTGEAPELRLFRYSAEGEPRWTASRGGGPDDFFTLAAALDGDGNSCVLTAVQGQPRGQDFLVVKRGPSGDLLWEARHGAGDWRSATALAIDPDGGIYVTGFEEDRSFSTVKYSPEGAEEWARSAPAGDSSRPLGIAVDSAGDLIVTGSPCLKYSRGGELVWKVEPLHGELPWAAALDGAGNVLFARGCASGESPLIEGIDRDGSPFPVASCGDPVNGQFGLTRMAIAGPGKVVVTGIRDANFTTMEYAYDPRSFRRGDASGDGRWDITDAIFILGRLFAGFPAPVCSKAADADDSGSLEVTDAVYLLLFLFLGGPAPPPPFPTCGLDSTADGVDCAHAACNGAP